MILRPPNGSRGRLAGPVSGESFQQASLFGARTFGTIQLIDELNYHFSTFGELCRSPLA
jgi:hypothetical protein